MSSPTPGIVANCPRCGQPLAAGTLVCDKCRTLVHAADLESISFHARDLEKGHQYMEARSEWSNALQLLPADSKQAAWIRDHISELERTAGAVVDLGLAEQHKAERNRASITAFIVSFVAFLGFETLYADFRFGLGLSTLILIHEFGHYIDITRRGMKADLPVFLPGIGAFVRFRNRLTSPEVRAGVSIAGPFAGFISAAVCAVLWRFTGESYWASLAQSAAWLNLVNLTPVWMLDGGQAASALSRTQRALILLASIGLWYWTRETSVFFIVAAGAFYRTFAKDTPKEPSNSMAAYFLITMLLLAAVMWYVPGTGFGIR